MEAVEFSVPALSQASAARRQAMVIDLSTALLSLSGVEGVDAEFAPDKVRVRFDPSHLDREMIRDTLTSVGYPVGDGGRAVNTAESGAGAP